MRIPGWVEGLAFVIAVVFLLVFFGTTLFRALG